MNHARESSRRLADLLHREHSAMADFLIALADFDRRRLWLQLGHSSLFYFLHRELRLSKGAAYYRKVAADLIQRFPDVIEPLREGRLCITSVGELARVMTPENRAEVLPRFFYMSKREAKALAMEMSPAGGSAKVQLAGGIEDPPSTSTTVITLHGISSRPDGINASSSSFRPS